MYSIEQTHKHGGYLLFHTHMKATVIHLLQNYQHLKVIVHINPR